MNHLTGERVPTWLRGTAYHIFRPEPLRSFGTSSYRRMARYCGQVFSEVPGVETVWLRGGLLERCLPAVSDIDLTLKVSAPIVPSAEAALVQNLRRIYQRLKRSIWVLGEVGLLSPKILSILSRVGPAPIALRHQTQRVFRSGVWEKTDRLNVAQPSQASRFSFCLEHYGLAYQYLTRSLLEKRWSAFHREFFFRNIRKCLAFATEGTYEGREKEPTVWIADAFAALHELAVLAREEKLVSPYGTCIWEEPKATKSDANHSKLSTIWWIDFQRLAPDFVFLEPTPTPFCFLWKGPLTRPRLGAIFHYSLSRLGSRDHALTALAPKIYTPAMFELVTQGWAGSDSRAVFNPSFSRYAQNPKTQKQFRIGSFQVLLENTIVLIKELPELLITSPRVDLSGWLNVLSLNACQLSSGLITQNVRQLQKLSKKQLPHTTRFLQFGAHRDGLSERGLIEASLEIKNEISDMLLQLLGE